MFLPLWPHGRDHSALQRAWTWIVPCCIAVALNSGQAVAGPHPRAASGVSATGAGAPQTSAKSATDGSQKQGQQKTPRNSAAGRKASQKGTTETKEPEPATHRTVSPAPPAEPNPGPPPSVENSYDSAARMSDNPATASPTLPQAPVEAQAMPSGSRSIGQTLLFIVLAASNLAVIVLAVMILRKLVTLSKGIESFPIRLVEGLDRSVAAVRNSALRRDDLRAVVDNSAASVVDSLKRAIASAQLVRDNPKELPDYREPSNDLSYHAGSSAGGARPSWLDGQPIISAPSGQRPGISETIDAYCRGQIVADELIAMARANGIRWGSAVTVRGQTKLQMSFDDNQNKILIFETGRGTQEFFFVLKDSSPWGSLDLKRFFEFDGGESGASGTNEYQVHSTRPGQGKLEQDRDLVVVTKGTVAL